MSNYIPVSNRLFSRSVMSQYVKLTNNAIYQYHITKVYRMAIMDGSPDELSEELVT